MQRPNLRLNSGRVAAAALILALAGRAAANSADETIENGTDPTKLISSAAIQYEHFALRPWASNGTLKLSYTVPFGEQRDYSLRLRVPVVRTTIFGNGGYGLGDVQLQLSHVFGVTRAGGMVLQGDLSFDTARRPELGTGKTVFKGTFIRAWFLSGGAIIAPAIVHSSSFGGDASRAQVNVSTFDLYYVPRLANPRHFVTVDPAITRDWRRSQQFASLAVTFGTTIGRAFGGNAQVFAKPTLFAGSDRPSKWGLEIGYRILGF
jgi:hypothetical protein